MYTVDYTQNTVYMYWRQRVIDSQYAIVEEGGTRACVYSDKWNKAIYSSTKPRSLSLLILACPCLANATPQG